MKKQILIAAVMLCALAGSKQTNAQWGLTGNAATNPATNFIGTTDLKNLNIRTNNANRITVASDGKVGIGITAPTQLLDVQSVGTTNVNVKSTASNANLLIDRFNSASNASVSYRTNGSPTWQTGTLGNDNFGIRNITLGSNAFTLLASNNYVGIGTNAPAAPLDVAGANNWDLTNTQGDLRIGNTITNFRIGLALSGGGAGNATIAASGNILSLGTGNTSALLNTLNISQSKVGIGTLTPATELDVRGANPVITVGSNTGTGGGIYLGNSSHGLQRGFPVLNNDNNVGLYTQSGDVFLSTNGNSVGEFVLSNAGNVGIGNSTPSQRLDVTGNAQISGNVITDAYQTNNGTATGFGLQLGGTSSGEVISSKRTASGNQFGIDFYTASIKRLAINNNGYVGINVDVPSAHLEVSSVSSTGTTEIIKNTGTGNVGLELRSTASPSTQFIDFQDGATSNTTPDYRNRISSTPTSLAFSSNTKSNAMVMTNNGNIGINTTTPAYPLNVNGSAAVDGSLYVRNATSVLSYGTLFHTGSAGNLHMDTYGPGAGLYLNYFSGNVVHIGNGASGYVASFLTNGNVGIGTTTPGYKLDVCGTIRSKEVRVETGWCDYVFADNYKLRSLAEVESFIKENKHLPDVTPGDEIESNGLEVGKAASQMIKKIEELTLYVIEQQKAINAMQSKINDLTQTKK